MRGPSTVVFHAPVCTTRSFHATSRGSPTLTATSWAMVASLAAQAFERSSRLEEPSTRVTWTSITTRRGLTLGVR